ncbi:MAG: cytochrome b/b6 domain-containing protein [Rhodobacterales bacterium]|nr:cytochrome b/b6 domain-containing protein [Rhodobacterales bacterium]
MKQATGYSGLQIGLHWLILILIGVNYFVSEGMEEAFDAHTEGAAVAFWPSSIHVYLGLAILALVLIRLIVRLVRGAPEVPVGTNSLLRVAGEWSHILLYALMIAVPVLGATAWYLGLELAAGTHVLMMNAMLILAGVHAAAALFHQFVLKDNLLDRMRRPG